MFRKRAGYVSQALVVYKNDRLDKRTLSLLRQSEGLSTKHLVRRVGTTSRLSCPTNQLAAIVEQRSS